MRTTAPRNAHDTTPERVLFMACELRANTWKLGGTTGPGQKPRERAVAARHQARLLQEIAPATRRFGRPDPAPVVRGDAAGRAGFWLHRFWHAQAGTNDVVDASAIAGKRRKRRTQSAAMDVRKVVRMFMRYHPGEREGGRGVPGSSVEAEDQRPLPRARDTRQPERASTTTRIKGLLRSQGGKLTRLTQLPAQLDARRLGAGAPIPRGLRRRVLRVSAHHQWLRAQSAAVEAERRAVRQRSQAPRIEQVRQLRPLRGLGSNGAWAVGRAFFAWRACKNRREVGG